MSDKGPAFHRQYVRVLNSVQEVHAFVFRNHEEPWFEVISTNMRVISWRDYLVERYVVLYTATEPLS